MHASARVPLARSDELVVEELADELLVYDLKSDRAHSLSSVAARVWRECDGSTRVPAIAARLELDDQQVVEALDELARCDLLASGAQTDGFSRRDLTVKVMKGAAVAAVGAPMIVSIIAPARASAASPIPGCEAIGSCLGNCGSNTFGCKNMSLCRCCPLDAIPCPPGGGGTQRLSNIKFCVAFSGVCPSRTDPTVCRNVPCPAGPGTSSRQSQPSANVEPQPSPGPSTGVEPSPPSPPTPVEPSTPPPPVEPPPTTTPPPVEPPPTTTTPPPVEPPPTTTTTP